MATTALPTVPPVDTSGIGTSMETMLNNSTAILNMQVEFNAAMSTIQALSSLTKTGFDQVKAIGRNF